MLYSWSQRITSFINVSLSVIYLTQLKSFWSQNSLSRDIFKFFSIKTQEEISVLHMQVGRHEIQEKYNLLLKGNNFLSSEINHSGIHVKKQCATSFSFLYILFVHVKGALRRQKINFQITRTPKQKRQMIQLLSCPNEGAFPQTFQQLRTLSHKKEERSSYNNFIVIFDTLG